MSIPTSGFRGAYTTGDGAGRPSVRIGPDAGLWWFPIGSCNHSLGAHGHIETGDSFAPNSESCPVTAGVVWAVLAGIAFGFSQLSNRGVNRQTDAMTATTAMVTGMLVALVAATAVTGDLGDVGSMPAAAIGWFVAASLVHFLVGWTLFAVSQQRIGPSRTASVLSTNPVMAALIAAVAINQDLLPITWVGVIAVTLGVATVATTRAKAARPSRAGLAAVLAATLMFSISPIFVTFGLDRFNGPLLGLAIGIAVTVPGMHVVTRLLTGKWVRIGRSMAGWLVLGGITAGFAITAQWTAFDLIEVGAVVSLQQLSTPVVIFIGPILLSAPRERADPRLLVGTGLILFGAVLVALFGRAVK